MAQGPLVKLQDPELHTSDGFLNAGPGLPAAFCRRLLDRLGTDVYDQLLGWLRAGGGGILNHQLLGMGSICSGTESPIRAMTAIFEAMHSKSGDDFAVRHDWACENDPRKQAFIRSMFPDLSTLYEDATDLTYPLAKCVVHDKAVPVRGPPLLVAGFPCTDVSQKNKYSRTTEHLQIVADGG